MTNQSRITIILLTKILIVACLVTPLSAFADTIAMIGTGSVGSALGPRFAGLGHQVVYGSRTPDREDVQQLVAESGANSSAMTPSEAVVDADIVVIAVPWAAVEEVVKGLGDLSGKIVIDPVNPRVIDENGYANYPSMVSNAEMIQTLAPQSKVVKAFSTISADTMVDPTLVDHPITIPLVGNDDEAKAIVADICQQLGYETLDFGPVHFAHILEGLYLLRTNARKIDEYFEWNYPRSKRAR